ncbi:F-box protein At5g65850-like [Arachis ipaensis]|uniref:F-box protein At5g65850-like n=1 Tax=Arachis ipaensis TaxID=130454 RepID=UPI000A2B66B1|nr:F-box protein At5g65850-like [Arachis ipaensis]
MCVTLGYLVSDDPRSITATVYSRHPSQGRGRGHSGFSSGKGGGGFPSSAGRGGSSKFCTHCGRSGHTIEVCYSKYGYPPGHPRHFDSPHHSAAVAAATSPSIAPPVYDERAALGHVEGKLQIRKSCFASLPVDVITDIFVRLPIKSVLICRCVCKHWNTLNNPLCCSVFEVLDPNGSSSIKLDPKFEIPLPSPKSIQGRRVYVNVFSCNGLFYLSCSMDRDISLVCNPITGEFIRLPKQPPILKHYEQISRGFGFHPKTNQYKVMRIYISKHDHRMVVEMHTVGASTWINIEVDYPKNLIHVLYHSAYFNGALHWIGIDIDGNVSIWAFNFDTERFQSFRWIKVQKSGYLNSGVLFA